MPLRVLLKYLANNEKLVQKMAESYPVRRAAQLCVSLMYRYKDRAEQTLMKNGPEKLDTVKSFFARVRQIFEEEFQQAKKQLKDNEKKR